MKPSKISELLEKINRIAADADFSKLSKLEFDLLMKHLRDLYAELDAVRNSKQATAQPEVTVTKRTLNPNESVLIKEPVTGEPVKHKKEEPVIKVEVKQKENISKSSINESVQSSSSLNESLKTVSKEVHRKLSTKPLKDLIDLNKKFILLNELFKGNAEAFSAAIHHIDNADDLAAAEAFIKAELSSNYYWDESSQPVRMFMKLVKQKFGEE